MAKLDLEFFERVIIQHCLRKDSAYLAAIIDYLDKSLFKDTNIAAIIEVIKNFYLERNTIPTLTEISTRMTTNALKESLITVVGYIKLLDKDCNADELVSNTEYFIKQRKYSALFEKAIDNKATNKEFDIENIQDESDKINAITLIDDFGLEYFGEMDRVIAHLIRKDTLISTGYAGLDAAFGGGFQAEGKAIYDIGGETNVGKSIFLANIALNVILQGKKVLIISPEMSEMRYAKRISGMISDMAIATIGDHIEDFQEKIAQYVEKYKSFFYIKEVPTKGVSARNIYAFIKKLKDRKGFDPDLICIDGHALLKASAAHSQKHTELQHITQECRGLSYAFKAPILTVAQLNRGSHKASNPGLDNMAGSWDQLADFDAHVNIWQTDEDREENIIRYGGKKVRDGAKGGEGFLRINYDSLRLSEDEDMMDSVTEAEEKELSEILDIDSLMSRF